MSHGEGFQTVFRDMFREPGLYLMDEPEAALSFSFCLQLVGLMYELGRSGAQVVCATHSPVLAATPDADVVELDNDGFRRTTWEDLQLVDHWRRYLAKPDLYLRHVVDAECEHVSLADDNHRAWMLAGRDLLTHTRADHLDRPPYELVGRTAPIG